MQLYLLSHRTVVLSVCMSVDLFVAAADTNRCPMCCLNPRKFMIVAGLTYLLVASINVPLVVIFVEKNVTCLLNYRNCLQCFPME